MYIDILASKLRGLYRQYYLKIQGHSLSKCVRAQEYFLVNAERGFIYCSIPKVASGSLTVWFLEVMGHENITQGSHEFARKRYALSNYSLHETVELWDSSFKFTFVRNPWSRLLSTYVSIFLQRRNPQPSHDPFGFCCEANHGTPSAIEASISSSVAACAGIVNNPTTKQTIMKK